MQENRQQKDGFLRRNAERNGRRTAWLDFVFETFFALCIAHIIILFIFELALLDLYPFFYLIFNG